MYPFLPISIIICMAQYAMSPSLPIIIYMELYMMCKLYPPLPIIIYMELYVYAV